MSEVWIGVGCLILIGFMLVGLFGSQIAQVRLEQSRWSGSREVRSRIDLVGGDGPSLVRSVVRVLVVLVGHFGLSVVPFLGAAWMQPTVAPWLVLGGISLWTVTLGPLIGSDLASSGSLRLTEERLEGVFQGRRWSIGLEGAWLQLCRRSEGKPRQWALVHHRNGVVALAAPHPAPTGEVLEPRADRAVLLSFEGRVLIAALTELLDDAPSAAPRPEISLIKDEPEVNRAERPSMELKDEPAAES